MAIESQLLLGVVNGLIFGLITALIALGLSLIFGLMRIVNVAHGDLYMLGAVATWYALNLFGSFWAALLLAPLVVGGIGIGIERIVLRPIEDKHSSTIIATFGLTLILQQSVLTFFGGGTQRIQAPIQGTITLLGAGYPEYRALAAALSAVAIVILWILIHRTRFGLWLRASQQNRELALATGIPVGRVYMLAFGLGAALASLGGAIAAPIVQIQYLMGLDILVLSFIVVIVGGVGNLKGTLVASILLGVVEGLAAVFFSPIEARILLLVVLVITLVARPRGLFGSRA